MAPYEMFKCLCGGQTSRSFIILNRSGYRRAVRLLVVLAAELGVLVGDVDVQLLGALDDGLSLLGADGVGDLGAENAVVHHQHLQLGEVVNHELLEVLLVLENGVSRGGKAKI